MTDEDLMDTPEYLARKLDDAGVEYDDALAWIHRVIENANKRKPYDANGDLVAKAGQRLRKVGWKINGGPNDGVLCSDSKLLQVMLLEPHGGFSPVYVEVGTD